MHQFNVGLVANLGVWFYDSTIWSDNFWLYMNVIWEPSLVVPFPFYITSLCLFLAVVVVVLHTKWTQKNKHMILIIRIVNGASQGGGDRRLELKLLLGRLAPPRPVLETEAELKLILEKIADLGPRKLQSCSQHFC